jgi:hypothetical protein
MAEVTQQSQVADDPVQRWSMEISASKGWMKKFHEQGKKVVARFRDEREAAQADITRYPYFAANVQTVRALLHGQVPSVDATRRWADATDDVARVAAEILKRLLNADIERDDDSFAEAAVNALQDRQLVGAGLMRVRYEVEFGAEQPAVAAITAPDGTEKAPAVPAVPVKTYECAETAYVHWEDWLCSPARVHAEVRWMAFRCEMTREALVKRFGEVIGAAVPLNSKKGSRGDKDDPQAAHPWDRAEVWEIWDKERKETVWYVEGFDKLLDTKPDPLGLQGFWPCPKPMLANTTTSSLLPKPDFALAQDLYNEIDVLSTRIKLLEDSVKVRGVYDRTAEGVKRLLTETGGNELIPIENWAMFGEKGGLKGVVDWLPLEEIVNALSTLTNVRREKVDILYQVTGMSDIMRGEATQAGATATEQRIKAQYGSVRMQAQQDEYASFLSQVQRLKAEIIAKHFDPATILERANVKFMSQTDQGLAPQAVDLIKSSSFAFRVEVKPEAVSMADFNANRQESTETLAALSQFFTAVQPLAQQSPAIGPYLLQILQWFMSRIRGASSVEGILDQAIAAAQQAATQAQANPQQAPPDPRIMAQQMKGQADLQKVAAERDADIARESFKVQADAQREQNQREQNVMEAAQKAQIAAANHAVRPALGPGVVGGRPVR